MSLSPDRRLGNRARRRQDSRRCRRDSPSPARRAGIGSTPAATAPRALSGFDSASAHRMPGGPVVGVGRNRARGEITHCFRAGADQPVMIGKRNERLGVVRPLGHRALERGQRINQLFAPRPVYGCGSVTCSKAKLGEGVPRILTELDFREPTTYHSSCCWTIPAADSTILARAQPW